MKLAAKVTVAISAATMGNRLNKNNNNGVTCDYCRLGVTFIFHRRHGTMFICVKAIQTSKVYSINNKKVNQWSSKCCRSELIDIVVTIVISNV